MSGEKTVPISQRTWGFLRALVNPEEGFLCQDFAISEAASEAIRKLIKDRMIFGEKKDPESNDADAQELTERARLASEELAKLCDHPVRVLQERIEPDAFQQLVILRARDIVQERGRDKEATRKSYEAWDNIRSVLKKLRSGEIRLAKPLPKTTTARLFKGLVTEKKTPDDYHIPIVVSNICKGREAEYVCEKQVLELSDWLNTPGNVGPLLRRKK